MGLILDSSVVIAAERRGDTVEQLIEKIVKATGDQEAALSAIGLTELIHGLYRAQTPEIRQRRESSGAVSKHKILGSDSDEYSAFAWAPNGKRLAYIKPAKDGKGGNSATHGFSIPVLF